MAVVLLSEIFGEVLDPRRAQGKRHPLPGVLALMSVAVMCGCRSLFAIGQWGRDHGREMAVRLGLQRKYGTPAVFTLQGSVCPRHVGTFQRLDRQQPEQLRLPA